MKNALALAVFLISTLSAQADPLAEKMKELGFLEGPPPKPGSDEWMKANQEEAWVVENGDAGLVIRAAKEGELYPPEVTFDTGTIKYLGIDLGEFGGGLYIDKYSKDEKPFFPGNIKALIPIGDDLYVVEGLAHMDLNGGSIHAIRNYKKPSTPERITLLTSAPQAVLADDTDGKTKIVMATHDGFMILKPDSELQMLHHDTFWGSLYPSSVVRYNDFYIVALRGGVVAIPTHFFVESRFRFFSTEKKETQ